MSGTGLTPNAFKQTINTGIYRSANVVSAFCGMCTIDGLVRREEKGMPDQIQRRNA